MTDRKVVVGLVLDTAGYISPAAEASKSTTALATAQKEAEASARAAGIAQRDAGLAARDAAATASAAAQAQSAAYKEATAAAKEASAAQVTAAKATTDAERIEAEGAAQAASERAALAKEALTQATAEAEATAKQAAAAKAGVLESAKYAAAQRDIATAAKEAATAEAAAAKVSEEAAATRSEAYKASGTALTTMAVGGAAAIGLMVKSAGDFESTTQHLVTDAGESQDKLAMVQAGILKTATATGTGATQLVDAMYHIESAGFHGQTGLDMLTVAAEGAKVGAADLGTVAKTLTGTMNSYSESGLTSVQMMNMLIATTAAGDMKMNDLAGSLGNVTPVAASAKISFAEVGGAIATMTSQNMSADRATQDLAHTIGSLQNPNNVQIAQMQQLGLDSNDVSENLGKRGLTGTLEMLTTAVLNHTQDGQVFIDSLKSSKNAAADANVMLQQLPASIQGISKELLNGSITAAEYKKGISNLDAPQQHMAQQFEQLVKGSGAFNSLLAKGGPAAETYNAAMSNLLGGATGLNTALMLTGGRMQTFKDNAVSVQEAANKSGTEVDNWSKIQGTFNQKLDVAKASIGAMGITIGTAALPMISDLAKWTTDIVTPITHWVDKNQGLTEGILGTAGALAGLVLAIKAVSKTQDLLTKAFEGIDTAIKFFGRSADAATAKTNALRAANAATAAESDAAALSAGGWATKLGNAIPVVGAATIGIGLLASAFDHTGGDAAQAAASVDQFTAAMINSGKNTSNASMAFGHAADDLNVLNEALAGKLAVNTKFEGKDVADLKRSFDFLAESSVASVEPMAQLGVELGKVNQVSGDASNSLKSYDGGLANLVSNGQIDRAKQLMAEITQVTDNHGHALINTARDFPQYFAALDKQKSDLALGIGTTQDATAATGANTGALDANAAAATGAAGATNTATAAAAAQTAAAKASALQLLQSTAASRALAQAQAAEATDTTDVADAHTSAKGATTSHTSATKDATTAAKDHTAAAAKDATAAKDGAKATADQSKAADAAAKADTAAAAAARAKAAADAAGGNSAKLNAAAKKAAATATRDAAAADKDSATAAKAAGTAHDAAGKAVDAHTKAVDAQAKAAADAAKAAGQDQAAQDAAAESARQAAQVHEIGTKWLLAVADAEGHASGSAQDLDQSVKDEISAMKDAKTQASTLKDALDALNGVHIAASKAAVDVQQKIADLTKALHDNGTTLDITTDAGRKNVTAIDDMASAALAHAQSVAEESGSVDAGNKALAASRDEFDAVLKSAGFSKDKIDDFNKTLLATPKLTEVEVDANTSAAAAKLQALADKYGYIQVQVGGGSGGRAAFATGGLVDGIGTGTSDSNMIAVSNKEYVVRAAAVARPGVLAELNALNFGTGNTTVVKPQIPMRALPSGPTAGGTSGSALHIEHYHENGASPQAVAADLAWLATARGGSW